MYKPCDNRMTNCYSRHIRGFCQYRCKYAGGNKIPDTGRRKMMLELTEDRPALMDYGWIMIKGRVQI